MIFKEKSTGNSFFTNKKSARVFCFISIILIILSILIYFFIREQKAISAANDVEVLIENINFTSIDAEIKITEAKTAYYNLTEKEKELVKNYTTLTNYQNMINNIHNIEYEISSFKHSTYSIIIADIDGYVKSVQITEDKYNQLSDVEKAKINNYIVLEDALKRLKKMYCYLEGCNNKAGNGYYDMYCDEHRCNRALCGGLKAKGKKFCSLHACNAPNCNNFTINDYDLFCSSHRCLYCKGYAKNGMTCINHCCNVQGCNNYKNSTSLFCSLHTCYVAFCKNPKPSIGASYCHEHSRDK